MADALDKLTIKGFKSIRLLEDFSFRDLNVFIGANGAGKSNLIEFFKVLRKIIEGNLNDYVMDNGGISDFLFNGRKITQTMEFITHFGPRGYKFTIKPGPGESCLISDEARYYEPNQRWWTLSSSYDGTATLVKEIQEGTRDSHYSKPVYDSIASWQIYHFHDTSKTAGMRQYEIIQDDALLRFDGRNIAPYLRKLKQLNKRYYSEILSTIRLIMPFFDDFILEPREMGSQVKVNLSWKQKGSDYPLQPSHFSDGSIRFICLATVLLQPELPATIIIDEPELGLHPQAISILGELVRVASRRTRLIIATQSAALLDQFSAEDIVVVNRKDGASSFQRLSENDLSNWLEDYSLGELWTKNVIAGGPVHE